MVSVVGYAFNADTFCLDCTTEYVEEQLKLNGITDDQLEDMSLETMTSATVDSEGNDLHPMFDIDEQVGFDAVCSCGDTILEKTIDD